MLKYQPNVCKIIDHADFLYKLVIYKRTQLQIELKGFSELCSQDCVPIAAAPVHKAPVPSAPVPKGPEPASPVLAAPLLSAPEPAAPIPAAPVLPAPVPSHAKLHDGI